MKHNESHDSRLSVSHPLKAFSLPQDYKSMNFETVFAVLWMLVILLVAITVEG